MVDKPYRYIHVRLTNPIIGAMIRNVDVSTPQDLEIHTWPEHRPMRRITDGTAGREAADEPLATAVQTGRDTSNRQATGDQGGTTP